MSCPPRFEAYRGQDGWRWRLRAGNSRIVATGEAHPRKADAQRASANFPVVCAAAVAGGRRAPRVEIFRARDGWRWRLRARNGRIVAGGESHPHRQHAGRAAGTAAALAEIANPA